MEYAVGKTAGIVVMRLSDGDSLYEAVHSSDYPAAEYQRIAVDIVAYTWGTL